MAHSTIAAMTAATAATGGIFYGVQAGADRKFTQTAAGAAMNEAADAAAQRTLLNCAILGANTFTGAQTIPAGSAAAPTLNFTGNTNTGFFQRAGGYIMAAFSGAERMHFSSTGIQIPSGSSFNFNSQDNTTAGGADLLLCRMAAGVLQLGQDSTSSYGTPQRLQACNQVTADGAGASLTLSGGNCLGTAGGGDLILATYAAGALNVPGTLTARITINHLGEIFMVLPNSSSGVPSGALYTDAGVVKQA